MKANSKINTISIGQLANLMRESAANGQRFCFILGSGASVTSGIPMGRVLEERWMACLMGEAPDGNAQPKNPADTEKVADQLFSQGKILTSFADLKAAWEKSKKPKGYIPSEYYFNIYALRFYPVIRNGYKYLEHLMEKAKPSIGYHPLARLLAQDNGIDLVITTNFDNLTEDALFIFTEKRPLVVAHESLSDYIELSRKQRPVVAKVHRGLFYEPMSERESTSELSEGWKDALGNIFAQYTPVVIGYAGGDRSLMSFLEEKSTRLSGGIYWCLMNKEKPEKRIKDLVAAKKGMFVKISGFDDAMLTIGGAFLNDSLIPIRTGELLEKNAKERFVYYYKQWKGWKGRRAKENAGHNEDIARLTEAEKKDNEERNKKVELTALDHYLKADSAYDEGRFDDAIQEYTECIKMHPYYEDYYIFRGKAYVKKGEATRIEEDYKKAVKDFTKAIELNAECIEAYRNRSNANLAIGNKVDAENDKKRADAIEEKKRNGNTDEV